MKKYIKFLISVSVFAVIFSVSAFALTENEVQNEVSRIGREGVTGNIFVWFLCAVAFLKVSQKIDSFMSSLGINVGHTGGSMLAEALITAKSIGSTFKGGGKGISFGKSHGSSVNTTAFNGGLSGMVGRGITGNAVKNANGTKNGGIGGKIFDSSLAKGGAVGGAVGAAAAFAFENRRLIAAVVIGLTVILLLPAVIISMLPSLIFGGTDSPDLNNPAAVTENIQVATGVINTVFGENLKKISEEIEKDKTEGIKSEIIYPQTQDTEYTAALIISQYCAAKEKDYKDISLPDFERTVKTADNIYRYKKAEETRTIETAVTVVNAETGEETENIITAEEKVTVYTVFYNGEDYFAESVFNLNEEQKTLAKDYLENLMLYLSGGI